jgi:hypothetical protein
VQGVGRAGEPRLGGQKEADRGRSTPAISLDTSRPFRALCLELALDRTVCKRSRLREGWSGCSEEISASRSGACLAMFELNDSGVNWQSLDLFAGSGVDGGDSKASCLLTLDSERSNRA